MTLRIAVVTLAVAVPLIAACGAEKTTETRSSAASMSRATASSTPSGAATASTSREQKTVEEEPVGDLVGFTSPTGAISCMLDDRYVRCDVQEHTWTLPPRPADCEFDYGQGVGMSAGEQAELVCAGDTTAGAGAPLAYGLSVTVGSLSCQSAETGVTCRDAGTGHGFTVAREAYAIF